MKKQSKYFFKVSCDRISGVQWNRWHWPPQWTCRFLPRVGLGPAPNPRANSGSRVCTCPAMASLQREREGKGEGKQGQSSRASLVFNPLEPYRGPVCACVSAVLHDSTMSPYFQNFHTEDYCTAPQHLPCCTSLANQQLVYSLWEPTMTLFAWSNGYWCPKNSSWQPRLNQIQRGQRVYKDWTRTLLLRLLSCMWKNNN